MKLQIYLHFLSPAKGSGTHETWKEFILILPLLFMWQVSGFTQTGNTILSNLTKQDVSCFGASDGTAAMAPTGGTPPYTFLWSTGATTSSVSGLSAGPYGYTITDAVGNTKIDGFSILHPGPVIANASSTPITGCLPAFSGTATVNPSGGTPPYTVNWSNGQTGSSISVLARGAYSYTITDSRGCTRVGGLSILGPGPVIPQITINHISCFGNGDGSASLSPFGGTPPYTYQWSTGSVSSSISGLQNAVYAYTVTDAGGCTREGDFSIITPWPIIPRLTVENAGCFGDGSAALDPIEGTPPFTFLWSTGATGSSVDGLTTGTYGYTITDSNGCVDTGSFEIGDQSAAIFCRIDVLRNPTAGNSDGMLRAVAAGGASPYSFEWSNGQSGDMISNLASGVYEVSITDADGCSTMCSFSLQPSICENVTDPGSVGFDQELCGSGNDPDPIVSLEEASGGVGNLQYLWMKSTTPGPFDPLYWEMIPGATGPGYDPGPVYVTTYFIRCARRDNCPFYLESNMITIEVGTDAIAQIVGPAILCQNTTATYTAITATSSPVISWQFTGPLYPLASSGSTISVRAGNMGLAEVILTVTENGCTSTNRMKVTVSSNLDFCGGENFLIPQTEDRQARAYPNPSRDHITLELPYPNQGEASASLYNALGKLELQFRLAEGTEKIDLNLASLPSGIYFLELLQHNGKMELIKIQRL